MGQRGSTRNEQKADQRLVKKLRVEEKEARTKLKELQSRPLYKQTPEYRELVRLQAGILKRAIAGRKKSETHSRKGKGGNR